MISKSILNIANTILLLGLIAFLAGCQNELEEVSLQNDRSSSVGFMNEAAADESEANDREVLEEFYQVNLKGDNLELDEFLGWDLDAPDMSEWRGVTVEDGRVTALSFNSANHKIYEIPASIGRLAKLKKLFISGRLEFESLPAEIGELKELTFLSIFRSKWLKELPKEIGGLTSLKTLSIRESNMFETLPAELGNLDNLEHLTLLNNNISSLPEEMVNMSSLFILTLNGNPITEEGIPEGLCTDVTSDDVLFVFYDSEEGVRFCD
ncbi:MAG: hypothetical protein AAF551_09185 [Bacteroidota bacterium]